MKKFSKILCTFFALLMIANALYRKKSGFVTNLCLKDAFRYFKGFVF